MALAFVIFALSAIAATADVNQGEVTPLEKVIIMLEDLQTEVVTEGKAEAKTYDKFACFCKDLTKEKSEAITNGQEDQGVLQSAIEELISDRDGLDEEIAKYMKAIKELEEQMKELEAKRAETQALFDTNAGDMKGALAALDAAIDALKSSRPTSFAQIRPIIKTVRKATLMADALGFGSPNTKRAVAALLEQPEVPMQNYDFHSEEIISMLEKLKEDFTSTKNGLNAEEVKSIAEHDKLMQAKTTEKKDKELDLEKTQKRKGTIVAEIQVKSGDLSTVSATLLDDQEYLKELAKNCQAQGVMWDQRTRVRKDELTALTQAISVIKGTVSAKTTEKTVRFVQRHVSLGNPLAVAMNDNAMEAIEAGSEEDDAAPNFFQIPRDLIQKAIDAGSEQDDTAPNFLQKANKDSPDEESIDSKRAAVIALLRSESKALKSTLLASLVTRVASDPFVKIRKLIQELIERLLQEAADEANHKGWCDKETSKAKQQRDYKADEIEELNGALASNEASRDKLTEEITTLDKEIKELEDQLAKATKTREDEKAENEATIKEAEEGQVAVEKAIKILSEFYEKAAQEGAVLAQDVPEMPDAGFDGAYKGKGSESGGILGMLDVILSDFKRTITVTTKDETQAAQEFLEFDRQTKTSIATKTKAHEAKSAELKETEANIENDMEDITTAQELLDKALQELTELHSACVDTGMSYAERAALREQEVDSLKKALCILDKMGPVQTEGC